MIPETNKFRVFIALSLFPLVAMADGGYLRSAVPMDEPRGYCLDVAGFGVNARPDEPLRVHTCKYGEDNIDQLFRWVDDESGHVAMPAYDRCLAAESLQAGAQVFVHECDDSELQAWTFVPNGNLVLRAKPDLCLTMGDERFDAGSEVLVYPGYQYRSSTMQTCRERGDELQDFRWGRDDEHVRGMANALRSGMPADVRDGIRRLHVEQAEGAVAKTGALYANVERTYRPSEVETTADLSYGEHERHKLDVHVDTRRRGDALQPVVMYFHGGGFVRGSKESSRNVGEYFASIGLVGVSATYRLAPEVQWPEGANDVGAAVQWVKDNIKEYGGDPDRIYVIGKSAGGRHVAAYALRPEVLSQDYARAAGIFLLSSVLESPTPVYFGAEDSSDGKVVLGNVSTVDMEIMLATAEFDRYEHIASTLALAHELASKHDTLVRVRQFPGHNHYSTNMSIGTADRLLSNEILDFVLAETTLPSIAQSAEVTKIGIIGSGKVGSALGTTWVKAGHEVMFSSRHIEHDQSLAAELGAGALAGTPREAAAFGEVLLVAVPYGALPDVGKELADLIDGKVIIDACNPFPNRDGEIADWALEKGAGYASAELLPGARIVRAFNAIGAANMGSAYQQPGRIGMPIAGDDADAVAIASALILEIGYEPVLVGGLEMGKYLMPRTALGGERSAEEIRRIAAELTPAN